MTVAGTKQQQTAANANRDYFLALATTRASLERLALLAVLVVFILCILNFKPLNPPSSYAGYEMLSYLAGANVIFVWISAGFLVLSIFKKFVYRFQVFCSYAMAGMALVLVYALCLLALVIATLPQSRGEQFYATLFAVVGLVAVGLVTAATVVHVLLLRRRLRVGHSEKRTIGVVPRNVV